MFYKEGDKDMNFDIIVGNPPYQETVGTSAGNASLGKQLFPWFMITAMELNPLFSTLITPSRWFLADAQDKSFIKLREYVKDNNHFKRIVNYTNNKEIFPTVEVGSVNYYLYEREYKGNVEFGEFSNDKLEVINRPLFENGLDIILPLNKKEIFSILDKVTNNNEFESFMKMTNGRNAFGITGKDIQKKGYASDVKFNNCIEVRCAHEKIVYVEKEKVTKNIETMEKWKIFTSKANGGAGLLSDNKEVSIIGKSFIAKPMMACTDSLIPIGCFDDKIQAENLCKYMSTKFLRFMVGILKSSQNLYQPVYKFVPIQNFKNESDIDWSKNTHEIDLQLYKKYALTEEEINYIENKIKEMEQ
jgi:hypothetical protein